MYTIFFPIAISILMLILMFNFKGLLTRRVQHVNILKSRDIKFVDLFISDYIDYEISAKFTILIREIYYYIIQKQSLRIVKKNV